MRAVGLFGLAIALGIALLPLAAEEATAAAPCWQSANPLQGWSCGFCHMSGVNPASCEKLLGGPHAVK